MANTAAAGQASTDPGTLVAGKDSAAAAGAAAAGEKATPDKPTGDAATAGADGAGAAGGSDTGDKAGGAEAPPKVPDKYELTVPKGAEAFVRAENLEEIAALAKANKWTAEQAQEAVEHFADGLAAKSAAWQETTKADPDYGGDRLSETQRLANRVIDRFRPTTHKWGPAFRELLVIAGLGNHIQVVSFLADIGKAMAEDKPIEGAAAGGIAKETTVQKIYGPDAV